MQENRKPLEYAVFCCDSMMRSFEAEELPPKGRFHYHQGVLLSGFERTWKQTGDKKYLQYMKTWVDSILLPDGTFSCCHDRELDGIMPCLILLTLYEQYGCEQYRIALENAVQKLKQWDFTPDGGFWHMRHLKDQMWLDGFYMASPLLVRCGLMFHDESLFDMAYTQMRLMRDAMRDEKTGLFYHACDFSRQAAWCDSETGLSEVFWGRAMGWYVVAAVDIASYLPASYAKRQEFIDVAVSMLRALAKYQEPETGLWYQVVNEGDRKDNWLETSCSALYTYAMSKALRFGWLESDYEKQAEKGYRGVINTVEFDRNGNLNVPRICIGTCLGDYKFYINRSTQTNMLIGVGAFLLMCNEYEELLNCGK